MAPQPPSAPGTLFSLPPNHQPPFAWGALGSHSRPTGPHSPVAPLTLTSDPPTSIRPRRPPLPLEPPATIPPQAAVALTFDLPTPIRPPAIPRSPPNHQPPFALRPPPGLRLGTSFRPHQPALPFSTQGHLSPQAGPSRPRLLSPPIPHASIPNGSRFTCAAKRSGAASGASACWAAFMV